MEIFGHEILRTLEYHAMQGIRQCSLDANGLLLAFKSFDKRFSCVGSRSIHEFSRIGAAVAPPPIGG